MVTLMTL